jgi:hypothetical protein
MKRITTVFVACLVYFVITLGSGSAAIYPDYPDMFTGSMNYTDNPVAFMWYDDQHMFGQGGDYTLHFYEDAQCQLEVGQMRIRNECYTVLDPCQACQMFTSGVTYYYTVGVYSDDDDDDDGDEDEDDDDDDATDPVEFVIDLGDVPAALGCQCQTMASVFQDNLTITKRVIRLLKVASNFLFSPSTAHATYGFPGYFVIQAEHPAGYPAKYLEGTLNHEYYSNTYPLMTRENGCDITYASGGPYRLYVYGVQDYYPYPYTINVAPCFQVTAVRVVY